MNDNKTKVDLLASKVSNERLIEILISYAMQEQNAMSKSMEEWEDAIDMVNLLKAKILEKMN